MLVAKNIFNSDIGKILDKKWESNEEDQLLTKC